MFPFRDIILTGTLIALVPTILVRPFIGPLAWAWVSFMAPHRLTWGFAYNLPFAQVIAITTLVAFFICRDRRAPPSTTVTTLLAVFYLWVCVTSLFALNQTGDVEAMWFKVTKIQLMLWVTIVMLNGRRHIELLIWTIVVSIGYYGFKGGVWVVLKGGGERVYGPEGSFIEGNNELAVALVIIIPLMYYLRSLATSVWARRAWVVVMLICGASVLGSHSRGAFLAIAAMAILLGFKSGRPVAVTALIAALGAALVVFMPDNWSSRMSTITTHEDHSAQSRLYTWRMIWNLVTHRPLGAGFDFWTPEVWAQYAVDAWEKPYSPHSIYFQALGEHGFVGLALYVGLGIATWRLASRMIRESGSNPETAWLRTLLRCIQASLLSFAVGGAFLNLVNFDLPYYLAAIVMLLWRDCRAIPAPAREAQSPAPPATRRTPSRPPDQVVLRRDR